MILVGIFYFLIVDILFWLIYILFCLFINPKKLVFSLKNLQFFVSDIGFIDVNIEILGYYIIYIFLYLQIY